MRASTGGHMRRFWDYAFIFLILFAFGLAAAALQGFHLAPGALTIAGI